MRRPRRADRRHPGGRASCGQTQTGTGVGDAAAIERRDRRHQSLDAEIAGVVVGETGKIDAGRVERSDPHGGVDPEREDLPPSIEPFFGFGDEGALKVDEEEVCPAQNRQNVAPSIGRRLSREDLGDVSAEHHIPGKSDGKGIGHEVTPWHYVETEAGATTGAVEGRNRARMRDTSSSSTGAKSW